MQMCRMCEGKPLSIKSFNEFTKSANKAANNYDSLSDFLIQAKAVDSLRFDSGDEWGEPKISQSFSHLIFSNPDADEGLLLFNIGCWLDMQTKYTIVWNNYLRQARLWLHGQGPMPRERFEPTSKHLIKTLGFFPKYGNISTWFARKINNIAEENGRTKGNIYRLAGEICDDLYCKHEAAKQLKEGILPKHFSGGDHKRFWMFIMFLRRDNSIMKCLFTRALNKVDEGNRSIEYWFDEKYFNPLECELPVDTWVLTNWNKMAKKLNMPNFAAKYPPEVALKARELATKAVTSPSALDGMLFYS